MKLMKALVVMALVLFMAAPAFAEFKLNGYYRLQGTNYDLDDNAGDDYATITQRLRLMLTYGLNENVGVVYFIENDLDWGGNGDLGVDAKDVEIKNAYLYINDENFSAKLGAQGWTDSWNGLIFSDDLMAATAKFKLGAADLGLMYGKLSGDVYSNPPKATRTDDDEDVYGLTVAFAATDAVKVTLGAFVQDQEDRAGSKATCAATSCTDAVSEAKVGFSTVYNSAAMIPAGTNVYYGARVDAKVSDMVSLSGFGVMADLEDGDTYALDASAKFSLSNGSVLAEVFYAPEEEKEEDRGFTEASGFFYNGHNSMFMYRDLYATNNWFGEGKYYDALENGLGLTLLSLSGNFDFDVAYAGFGLHYADTDEDDLGTEVFVKVGKKVYGNVDLSVRGAMWNGGDVYGTSATDETKIIGMVNVGF